MNKRALSWAWRERGVVVVALALVVWPAALEGATIFSDDFSGPYPGQWVIGHLGGGGIWAWAWGDKVANPYRSPAGQNYFYPDNLHVFIERRGVSLEGYVTPVLSFDYIVDTEVTADYFSVNVRDQSGVWRELFRKSGPTSTLAWSSKDLDLSAFAGQTNLTVQFRFDSNGAVSGTPYDGVYLANVLLSATRTGAINVSVAGVAPGDISASVLYLGATEVQRKDASLGNAPGGTNYSLTGVPYGEHYFITVACWDMIVGDTSAFTFQAPALNRVITTNGKRPLTIRPYYSGGVVPMAGVTVTLFSWDKFQGQEHQRDSRTTDGTGNAAFQAWPCTRAGDHYVARVYQGATKIGEIANLIVTNTAAGSVYRVTTSVAATAASVDVAVAGVSPGDITASVLYQNGLEVKRLDSDAGTAPTGTTVSFSPVAYGANYLVDAYCGDMWVGETGPFAVAGGGVSRTINALPKRPLTIKALYSNGLFALPEATVTLSSWDTFQSVQHARATTTTDRNGLASFQTWPTTRPGERYLVRVYRNGERVWEQTEITLDNTEEGSHHLAVTGAHYPSSTIYVLVDGIQAGDISSASLKLQALELRRLDAETGTAPTNTVFTFEDVPIGLTYEVEVRCWYMLAGRAGPVRLLGAETPVLVPTYTRRPLTVGAFYADNLTPLPGATVSLSSWDSHLGGEHPRGTAATDASGRVTFEAWPTTLADERYVLRMHFEGELVWQKEDATVATTTAGSSYRAVTTATAPAAPAPALTASWSGTQVTISWPVSNAAVALESALAVGPSAIWTRMLFETVVQDGRNVVVLGPSGTARFFRLRRL